MKTFFVLVLLMCCLGGCGSEEQEIEKQIAYENLCFNLADYHVDQKEVNGENTTFYCENNEDSLATDKSIILEIRREQNTEVHDLKMAKEYFDDFAEYQTIKVYQDIEDESGITEMYEAQDGEVLYYLIYCKGECYFMKSEGAIWALDLIQGFAEEYLRAEYDVRNVICAKDIECRIIEEISYRNKEANYEIWMNGETEYYKANLKIEEEDILHYVFTLYDADDKVLQVLEWDLLGYESYPTFSDFNQDGYVDMKVVIATHPAYDEHCFYVWNRKEKCWKQAVYDDTLAYIEVEDGYLLNWIRSGEGYVIEKLIWNDNQLVLESKKYVEPEEDDAE